jgi:hypothetical protein
MLWRFRNKVVHGATVEEQVNLQLSSLRNKIASYYQAYTDNPSMVLAHHQFLFTTRSVEERLSGSYDSMSAWTWSVKEAIQVVRHHENTIRAASEAFFSSHPSTTRTSDTDSTYSAITQPTAFTLSLAPTEETIATTNTMSSKASSPCTFLGGSMLDEDDNSSLDSGEASFISSDDHTTTPSSSYRSTATDVKLVSVASLALGTGTSWDDDSSSQTVAYSINAHSTSTCTLHTPSHNSTEETNLFYHQFFAVPSDYTNTSSSFNSAVTHNGSYNISLSSLHPMESNMPVNDVEVYSVASQEASYSGSAIYSDSFSTSSSWADT